MFRGIIVEESLADNRILNTLKIEKIRITGHPKKEDRWHMYQVEIGSEEIECLKEQMLDGWYSHFWNGDNVIAIFSQGKSFEFKYSDKSTWETVVQYGLSIGIPLAQLDFPISEL
jgi:hypothetical protein